MKRVLIATIIAILLSSTIFFFYFISYQPKKQEIQENQTTPKETTSTEEIEKGKVFTPVEVKPAKNEIFIFSDKFEPSQLTISSGEEVKWINKDDKDHIIILSNPPLEKRITAGDYFAFQFTSKGIVEFTDKDTGAKGSITIS
jgi:plastocyanin